jgi:uncharacterized protein
MQQQAVLSRAEAFIVQHHGGDSSGHDGWHVLRVRNLAQKLAEAEGADVFICQLAALLHDVSDFKFNGGDPLLGGIEAQKLCLEWGCEDSVALQVGAIVNGVSYKGAAVATPMNTLEGRVVQDADRLDAMGALGIARVFAYGGKVGSPIHNPELAPRGDMDFETYKKHRGSSVNHFYEKLLLLKERMQTAAGRALAESRHDYMVQYLERFDQEWKGEI